MRAQFVRQPPGGVVVLLCIVVSLLWLPVKFFALKRNKNQTEFPPSQRAGGKMAEGVSEGS